MRDFAHGRSPQPIIATFALSLGGSDECVVAVGEYEMMWWGAFGDGTYSRSLFAVGGPALMATTLGISAITNMRRKAKAQAAASPAWRHVDDGHLYLSTDGVYFSGPLGFRPWGFDVIDVMELPQPGRVRFTGRCGAGSSQSFTVCSDWAELMFVLWIRARGVCPPQLHEVFPEDWLRRQPPDVDGSGAIT